MTTGELMVDLGGGGLEISVSNRVSSVDLFLCEINPNKKQKQTKKSRALRNNKSSLSESNYDIPQAPHYLIDQKQPHMFKIKNGLTVFNIYFTFITGLNNIKSLVKPYLTCYTNV